MIAVIERRCAAARWAPSLSTTRSMTHSFPHHKEVATHVDDIVHMEGNFTSNGLLARCNEKVRPTSLASPSYLLLNLHKSARHHAAQFSHLPYPFPPCASPARRPLDPRWVGERDIGDQDCGLWRSGRGQGVEVRSLVSVPILSMAQF
jgi:hypothetical protein